MTDRSAIPARVTELLQSSIHSIEALELLLVLRGAMERSWTAEELARELRLPDAVVVTALRALVLNELAVQAGEQSPGRYQYRMQAPETEHVVAELAEAYTQRRSEVLMQVSSHAIKRIRRGALRTFSSALRRPGSKKEG